MTMQRVKVIRDTPEEEAAALAEFKAEIAAARTRAHEAEAAGVPALKRLFAFATENSTGGSRRIAAFLAGLYNGARFPFDLTDLRSLDSSLFEDVMKVLRMDARATRKEVHCYFDKGGRRFEELIARYGLEKTND